MDSDFALCVQTVAQLDQLEAELLHIRQASRWRYEKRRIAELLSRLHRQREALLRWQATNSQPNRSHN